MHEDEEGRYALHVGKAHLGQHRRLLRALKEQCAVAGCDQKQDSLEHLC
jgi:hypothetical protein